MQFILGWDVALIEQLEMCNHTKPILSVYPPDFDSEAHVTQMCANGFNKQGVPLFKSRVLKADVIKRPTESGFWAAGFSFSSGDLIKECPYELRVGDIFFGEEVF